ncbi:hypothetical protein NMYAN_20098 [Nitrosomonas nitrosa]|uniref:Uncharacterized protein n=1 Tax=Nitrosomonas nitrosa TaxID=52442 RepID=A0A8H8Z0X6_9PROT|nr:hypothetical protein NMYAN_20098 [Nitrosomonas nitrosa]
MPAYSIGCYILRTIRVSYLIESYYALAYCNYMITEHSR